MSEFTENHNLEKPDEGESPWTDAHHDLVDNVEVVAEIRDAESALDTYNPKRDALFRSTDTGAVYLGDGTEWNLIDIEADAIQVSTLNVSSGTISQTPSSSSDIVNKQYVDDNTGGGDTSMSVHGNEYHDPEFAESTTVDNLSATDVGALPDTGGTVTGLTTISSDNYQQHIRLRRANNPSWDISPSTNANNSLAIVDRDSLLAFYLSSDGHIENNESDRTVMTEQGGRFDVQSSFPSTPEDGDVCVRTDEDLAYYYSGGSWNSFSDGGGGGSVDPEYWVDNYERDSLGSAYDSTTATIQASSAFEGDSGMYVPEQDGEYFGSDSGLDYYPEASGGPNSDGAFQFAFRFEAFNGSSHIARVLFARGGDQFYNCEFTDGSGGKMGFRHNFTDALTWNNVDQLATTGNWVVVKMHEWRTDGFIDIGLYDGDPDASGTTELRREQYTDSRSDRPQSGGIDFWTNYSTEFSFDAWELIG
jgi:hypothetical protein